MNIVTEIASMRSDLETLQQRIETRQANGITEDDPVIARMIGRKVELERALGVVDQLQTQLNAAKRGMDSAKQAGALMMEKGRKLAAENSPEAIESEREANAVLTAEVERLQQQNEYLSALASGQPLYGLEEKIADLMARNKALQTEVERLRAYVSDTDQWTRKLEQTVLEISEERDQLKAHCENLSMAASMAVGALPNESCIADVCVAAVRHFNGTGGQSAEQAIAQHNAEVIERAIQSLTDWMSKNMAHGTERAKGYGRALIELGRISDQLRQLAKEV